MSRRAKALKMRRARRTFSAEAKADAVRLVRTGMSVGQVAREHDLSGFSQVELNRVACELNRRPRKTLGFRSPGAMFGLDVALTG